MHTRMLSATRCHGISPCCSASQPRRCTVLQPFKHTLECCRCCSSASRNVNAFAEAHDIPSNFIRSLELVETQKWCNFCFSFSFNFSFASFHQTSSNFILLLKYFTVTTCESALNCHLCQMLSKLLLRCWELNFTSSHTNRWICIVRHMDGPLTFGNASLRFAFQTIWNEMIWNSISWKSEMDSFKAIRFAQNEQNSTDVCQSFAYLYVVSANCRRFEITLQVCRNWDTQA